MPGTIRKFLILFSVWVMLTVTGRAASAESTASEKTVYSLDKIYRLALERSEAVGISLEDLHLANLTRKKAFSVLMPEFSGYGSYTRYRTQ